MIKKILMTTSALVLTSLHATPTIYPKGPTLLSTVVNKTNSNLVADDADQRVFYVMPPNSAQTIVKGLHTMTSNIGFCREMGDLQEYSRLTSKKIKDLMIQEEEYQTEIEKLRKAYTAAQLEMAESATLLKIGEIVALDERLITIEDRLLKLNEMLLECTANCSNLREEIKELRAEKLVVSKDRRALAALHTKELRQYEKKKQAVVALKEDLDEKTSEWEKMQQRLISLHENFSKMYTSFSKMEGARAGLKFDSRWDSNIDSLRQENPGFDFKKMSTQNAVITTNIAMLNNIPTNGAILGYEIGGNLSEGKLLLPAYPENLSGNVRLSLMGACPVIHPEYFDINLPNGTDQMNYGMTVSYEYPTAFVAEASAKYNMKKIYEKIIQGGTKGGFFSRKSWSSVEERTYFKDSFVVTWSEQDSAHSLSDIEKADLEREMRNNIFARLAAIGLPSMSHPATLVTPAVPGKSGAVVLSDSLMKTCPGNYYCVGASMALNVLDAIFGSSLTTASYKNVQDAELTENWSRSKVIYKPWISTYN